MAATEFEIEGLSFKLEPLKVEQALRGLNILMAAILPVASAQAGAKESEDKSTIRDMLAGFDRIPELFELFAGSCKVVWDGKPMPLKAMASNVFERKTSLLLAWLVECIAIEYGDFLEESGQARLMSMASKLTSRNSLTGGSGVS